ncbi:MAG: DUF1848 domain-containing protein [Candidatus Adiutrix sp.]|nr:DUF1848 domain-containing protein [Candidatus Adiutrix sp.]
MKEEAARPLVLSASRATDIPAGHGRWFIERLRAGFLTRINPVNGRARRVELDQARAVVFWTKNPAPFLPYLAEVLDRGLAPVFQFTLNDYEAEGWEPNLPLLSERIETFHGLAGRLAPGSVIWRFDPLALGPGLSAEALAGRLEILAGRLRGSCERLVISFLDLYPKVVRRLARLGADPRPPAPAEARIILEALKRLKTSPGPPLALSACAEAGDYSAWGLSPARCVDAELLARLAPDLAGRPELFTGSGGRSRPRKDRGQRPLCGCAPSQDIGRYDTCGLACVYCYASR